MTSVFFFFSIRQRATVQIQRNTVEILNRRAYMESYAEYMKNEGYNHVDPSSVTAINFEDATILGSITKTSNSIEGFVDVYESDDLFTFSAANSIFVEWNRCDDNLGADLVLTVGGTTTYHPHNIAPGGCEEYDDAVGPIAIDALDDVLIQTGNSPTHFRITPGPLGSPLPDNRWHMELSSTLEYGKELTISETF